MVIVKRLKHLIKLWVPPICINVTRRIFRRIFQFYNRRFLLKNKRLKNLHYGERCFILGNSHSVRNYDLKKLAGEKVFSVSTGYLHPDYHVYKPEFHCVPQITYSNEEGGMSIETANEWIAKIEENTGNAILFLDEKIRRLRCTKNLLSLRSVSWIATSMSAQSDRNIDLARCIAPVLSVPQMAISIAIYMGFKEIYLLGVDHDEICQNKYEYFFDRKLMPFKDPAVNEKNELKDELTIRLADYARLFSGYKRIAKISKFNKCNIYNCSSSSFLDVFPYVPYESF